MDLKNQIKSTTDKVGFKLKKHSPEIMLISGLFAIGVAAVKACVESTKLPEVLEDHTDRMQELPGEDTKKETTKVYFDTAKTVVKMYGPSVVLGTIGVLSIVGSHRELRKRNAALTAAYTSLWTVYRDYRDRVIERFGEEVDYKLAHGIKEEVIEVEETDENGKVKKKKKKVDVATAGESPYMRYFTPSNLEWKGSDDTNVYFFKCVRDYANVQLLSKGFVTLNEVYSQLCMPETPDGMIVGWRYDKVNPTGDNIIDITWKKVYLPNDRGEYEEVWALDFNVDGNIYKEIKERDINSPMSGNFLKDSLDFPKLMKGEGL